jgi:hypothetical protein
MANASRNRGIRTSGGDGSVTLSPGLRKSLMLDENGNRLPDPVVVVDTARVLQETVKLAILRALQSSKPVVVLDGHPAGVNDLLTHERPRLQSMIYEVLGREVQLRVAQPEGSAALADDAEVLDVRDAIASATYVASGDTGPLVPAGPTFNVDHSAKFFDSRFDDRLDVDRSRPEGRGLIARGEEGTIVFDTNDAVVQYAPTRSRAKQRCLRSGSQTTCTFRAPKLPAW